MPVPTLWGWLLLLVLFAVPILGWTFFGENFLATTHRVPADTLVVEAWLREDGALAAAPEFSNPEMHYRFLVAAGGLTGERWHKRRWNEVEVVREQLEQMKFPSSAFIAANTPDVEIQRTYETAVAARRALESHGIKPTGINVLTRGPHARRSRLVFQKAFGPDVPVGVIAWKPPGFAEQRWWQSSERALDFLKESLGWVYEGTLSSGRWLNGAPTEQRPPAGRTSNHPLGGPLADASQVSA